MGDLVGFERAAPGCLALALFAVLASCNGCRGSGGADLDRSNPPGAARFSEEAEKRGLRFTHFNGSSGELYFAEIMGAGVGLLDYDQDGDLDVFLVQGRMLNPSKRLDEALAPPVPALLPLGHRLFRNDLQPDAAGRAVLGFSDVTSSSPLPPPRGYGMGVAVGDVNNDGKDDLYVTSLGDGQLLLNRGGGTFLDATSESGIVDPGWGTSATFFDYDRDGWLDLYVVHYVQFDIGHNPECRSPSGARDYCKPSQFQPEADRLFHNLGRGRFEDVSARAGISGTKSPGMGVASGDFNQDGWPDLYVTDDGAPNLLWINRGNGTFVEDALARGCAMDRGGLPKAGMGVAVGDADGDGDDDLLVTALTLETNSYYRNEGDGTFSDQSAASGLSAPSWSTTGFGAGWLDVDRDGLLDLLVVNGGVEMAPSMTQVYDPQALKMGKQLYLNRAGGRFAEIGARASPWFAQREIGRGLAIGDLDNDGDSDAVASNNGGAARLLLNQSTGGHWLGVRLTPSGGRTAQGSRLRLLRAGTPGLVRYARNDGSYQSASDPRVLFGLGTKTGLEGIEVAWPNGRVERFGPPRTIDRYITLAEGSGQPGRAAR